MKLVNLATLSYDIESLLNFSSISLGHYCFQVYLKHITSNIPALKILFQEFHRHNSIPISVKYFIGNANLKFRSTQPVCACSCVFQCLVCAAIDQISSSQSVQTDPLYYSPSFFLSTSPPQRTYAACRFMSFSSEWPFIIHFL